MTKGVTTRTAVLDAVARVIEQREHDLPGVSEIAREAGVSRPTFYACFPSAEDAFVAVVARLRDEVHRIQEDADPSSVEATYRSTLEAMLDLHVRHVGLLSLLASEARLNARVSTMWHDIFDRPVRRHARFIERLVERGEARPVAPVVVVAEAVNGVIAKFAQLIADNPARRDELADQLVEIQLRLVGFGGSRP